MGGLGVEDCILGELEVVELMVGGLGLTWNPSMENWKVKGVVVLCCHPEEGTLYLLRVSPICYPLKGKWRIEEEVLQSTNT